jgi:hypothetical protein
MSHSYSGPTHRVRRVAMITFYHEWKLSLACKGAGCTPSPFHYIYHHIQRCSVRSSWMGRYTLTDPIGVTLFHLYQYIYSVVLPTEYTEWYWSLSGVHSIMMEKLAQPGARPPPLIRPSPVKLQCTLQLSWQIHWPYFHSTPYILCGPTPLPLHGYILVDGHSFTFRFSWQDLSPSCFLLQYSITQADRWTDHLVVLHIVITQWIIS